jgi:hypothetical protein
MLKMTVYRQHQPSFEMTMADCLGAAVTEEDTDLIALSARTKRPALVGLDNQSSIIKPVGETTEQTSFEDLYDTCLTLVDLQHMREAKVANPEDVPLRAYRLDTVFAVDGSCHIPIALFAGNFGEVRARLRFLLSHDVMFREALYDALIQGIDAKMRTMEEIAFRVLESNLEDRSIDPPLIQGTGPAWRILES